MKINEILTKEDEYKVIQGLAENWSTRSGPNAWWIGMELLEASRNTSKLIKESISRTEKINLESLKHFSVTPIPEKQYYTVGYYFMNGKLVYMDNVIDKLTFKGMSGDRFLMVDDSGEQRLFPDETIRQLSYANTVFLAKKKSYDKMNTFSVMTFDVYLPNLNESIDESKGSPYLGPNEKVKINKQGMQVPLNKRGFGS